ncbi:MAG: DUF4139 domain-containing protein [Pseudomonadota bacterium]|nr:DUF4139 domain-containing protein [Pseudomonadota bacterium]
MKSCRLTARRWPLVHLALLPLKTGTLAAIIGALLLSALSLPAMAETQLTIYNQNFAVVKEKRSFNLDKGENEVQVTDITAHVEPDSVILRDLAKGDPLKILEQDYESDPLSEELLLSKMEGKELSFEVSAPVTSEKKIIKGKILRSGYTPHYSAFTTFGTQYAQQQMTIAGSSQPIVEVDGKVLFGLPGKPVFDSIDPKNFLKPTLLWKLESATQGIHNVELSYMTGGMSWAATYNLVAPETGDIFDLIGWVTLQNMSGKDFADAQVKLLAGDVARATDTNGAPMAKTQAALDAASAPGVAEKSFDEYHLYTIARPLTLHDREVKQVELLRSSAVRGKRLYVYDGASYSAYQGYPYENLRQNEAYGNSSQKKVFTMIEFQNAKDSGLGMPLPAGKIKLYRSDSDGRPEFVGEDRIDHTPKDETIRLYTGNSFDLVGERKRTAFITDSTRRFTDETFAVRVSNHKKEAVQIRIVEHLNRSEKWEITQKTDDFRTIDSHTVEFPVDLAPDETKTITYTAHSTW